MMNAIELVTGPRNEGTARAGRAGTRSSKRCLEEGVVILKAGTYDNVDPAAAAAHDRRGAARGRARHPGRSDQRRHRVAAGSAGRLRCYLRPHERRAGPNTDRRGSGVRPADRGRRHAAARVARLPAAVARARGVDVRVAVHDRRDVPAGVRLTRSTVAVGLIGLVGFLALVAGTLAGGTFLDAFDRRKILITRAGRVPRVLRPVVRRGRPRRPAARADLRGGGRHRRDERDRQPHPQRDDPRLLDKTQLPAAAALNQIIWNGAGLIGPALAGIVVAGFGFSWAYAIDLISIGLLLLASISIRPMPPSEGERATVGWRAVKEGFAFLRGRQVLQSTFVIDIIAMVFGMPRALFPVLAFTQFHRGRGGGRAPVRGARRGCVRRGGDERLGRAGSVTRASR